VLLTNYTLAFPACATEPGREAECEAASGMKRSFVQTGTSKGWGACVGPLTTVHSFL
jgi:hypothetical protein